MTLPNPAHIFEDLGNKDVKNIISISLIFAGLIVTIWGLNVGGADVVTETINGMEVELNNTDAYQWHWREFMGLGALFTGIGLWFFPSQRVIEAETGRYD